MSKITHTSATPSHYDQEAPHYDRFNENSSVKLNRLIEAVLKKHSIQTVLDLSCGTGSQVFWLHQKGFQIVGVDINNKMLKIAKSKARKAKLPLRFLKGDMRTTHLGIFDSALTIFNSIGHLTKTDFEKTVQNVHANLRSGGVYIFDIFNLNYLLAEDHITRLTIDWLKRSGDTIVREIQYSTINQEGVLASYDIYHEQKANQAPKITQAFQTLQVYNRAQLKALLEKNGFKVVQQIDVEGGRFSEKNSQRILTVAKKK